MRLLCVETPQTADIGMSINEGIVKVGNEYESIREKGVYYELEEHLGYFYNKRLFIPLSDIDETERIEEVLEQMFVKKEAI